MIDREIIWIEILQLSEKVSMPGVEPKASDLIVQTELQRMTLTDRIHLDNFLALTCTG